MSPNGSLTEAPVPGLPGGHASRITKTLEGGQNGAFALVREEMRDVVQRFRLVMLLHARHLPIDEEFVLVFHRDDSEQCWQDFRGPKMTISLFQIENLRRAPKARGRAATTEAERSRKRKAENNCGKIALSGFWKRERGGVRRRFRGPRKSIRSEVDGRRQVVARNRAEGLPDPGFEVVERVGTKDAEAHALGDVLTC